MKPAERTNCQEDDDSYLETAPQYQTLSVLSDSDTISTTSTNTSDKSFESSSSTENQQKLHYSLPPHSRTTVEECAVTFYKISVLQMY